MIVSDVCSRCGGNGYNLAYRGTLEGTITLPCRSCNGSGCVEVGLTSRIDDTPEEVEVYETIWGRFDFGGEG